MTTPPRLAIAIELGELERLMKIFIDEQREAIGMTGQLTLGGFLGWLRKRREIVDEETKTSLHNTP